MSLTRVTGSVTRFEKVMNHLLRILFLYVIALLVNAFGPTAHKLPCFLLRLLHLLYLMIGCKPVYVELNVGPSPFYYSGSSL